MRNLCGKEILVIEYKCLCKRSKDTQIKLVSLQNEERLIIGCLKDFY